MKPYTAVHLRQSDGMHFICIECDPLKEVRTAYERLDRDYCCSPCQKHKNTKLAKQMENGLSFARLSHTNLQRCEDVFHKIEVWTPTDWACAFAGEAGEVCNQVKKLRRLDDADKPIDTPERREMLKASIAMELADAVIYADLLASRLGINLADAVTMKFNLVSQERDSTIRL